MQMPEVSDQGAVRIDSEGDSLSQSNKQERKPSECSSIGPWPVQRPWGRQVSG